MAGRTQIEWLSLFQEHSQSGLSANEFCRQKGLCPKYFSKRKVDLKGSPAIPKNERAFVKVQRSVSANIPGVIKIKYHNTILCMPTSIAPNWLAHLLKSLA